MAIHQLVSRGVDAVQEHGHKVINHQNLRDLLDNTPGWVKFVLAFIMVNYFLAYIVTSYSYFTLASTLIMAEAPNTTTVIKTTEYRDDVASEEADPDAPLLTKEEKEIMTTPAGRVQDEEILVIKHESVTSSISALGKHLRTVTGSRLSHVRGFGAYCIYTFMAWNASNLVRFLLPYNLASMHLLIQAPLIAALCVYSTAVVHKMIAMPGPSFFKRVGALHRGGAFRKLFKSALAVEVVSWAAISLPQNIMIVTSGIVELCLRTHAEDEGINKKAGIIMAAGAAIAVFSGLLAFTCAVVPLNIALVRLQASVLPEEEETVIAIDRSLGGAAKADLKAAWKSFSRDATWRLIKTWVKGTIVQITLFLLNVTAVVLVLKVTAEPQFDRMVENGREMMKF